MEPVAWRSQRLSREDWRLLRAARIGALLDSPDSFGETAAEATCRLQADWQSELDEVTWVVMGEVAAMAAIRPALEVSDADAWIGGWWVAPDARGTGINRELLDALDAICAERAWRRQGLGVWSSNARALAAFSRLGFTSAGAPQPSARYGGRPYVRMLRTVAGPASD